MKALSNIWRTAALSACTAVVMGGMTACSTEDNMVNEEQTPAAQQQELKVTLTATFDEGAGTRGVSFGTDGSSSNSTFSVGDKIYIYNKTKQKLETNCLTVNNISADGKTANFSGTIYDDYDSNDELELYYNLTYFYKNNLNSSRFQYSYIQDGSAAQASACDYAIANATVGSVSGDILTLSAPVTLQKMQSVFRQRLTFKEYGNTIATPTISQLTVTSSEKKLVSYYFLDGTFFEMPLGISNLNIDSNNDIYLALRFSDGSTSSDALTFTAITSTGYVYEGTKTAPSGGFKNGRYYYGDLTLTLSNNKVLPTISWDNVESEVSPDAYFCYNNIKPKNGYSEIGLSGISKGYKFKFWPSTNTIVRLNNLTARWSGGSDTDLFLTLDCTNAVIDITGTNTIDCSLPNSCIYAPGDLRLSGSGTLTVTANLNKRCGLYGRSNYEPTTNKYDKTDQQDVTDLLAADGYTVIRSAQSGSGPYTWTYTVSPKLVQPTIAWNAVESEVSPSGNIYTVKPSTGNVIDFSLSGNSSAYTFNLRPSSSTTVRLNNFTALNEEATSFIYSEGSGTLTLNLTGDNTIKCRNWQSCIYSEGDLKLSGNGTLTVTSTTASRVGIYGDNYNLSTNNNTVTDGTADVSTLAATGSTVTRSAVTDNHNGTYTWTYTVTTP